MFSDELWVYVICGVMALAVVVAWRAVLILLQRVLRPRVFISYRRRDRPNVAGRIYQSLKDSYHQYLVFFDNQIKEGEQFPDVLRGAISASDVVVAVIGPSWDGRVTAHNLDECPRVLSPGDWVRTEVESAIEQNKHIIIVLAKDQHDNEYAAVPEYQDEQLERWAGRDEDRLKELRQRYQLLDKLHLIGKIRRQQGIQIALKPSQEICGIDELCAAINQRYLGWGRWWVLGWKMAIVPALFVWAIMAVVEGRVAAEASRVPELHRKKAELESSVTKLQTDVSKLQNDVTQAEISLKSLDRVIINPIDAKCFKEAVTTGGIGQFEYQYVFWKLYIDQMPQNNQFTIELRLTANEDPDEKYRVHAHFSQWEYSAQIEGKKKVRGDAIWVCGQVGAKVGLYALTLNDCRVGAGRFTNLRAAGHQPFPGRP